MYIIKVDDIEWYCNVNILKYYQTDYDPETMAKDTKPIPLCSVSVFVIMDDPEALLDPYKYLHVFHSLDHIDYVVYEERRH